MLRAQPVNSRPLIAGFGIVGLGVLVALATDVAASQLTTAKLAFLVGGFALLIPPMMLSDAKPYWLFLLVFSIPFDITKWLSNEMVDSKALVDLYGMPASGTIGLEIYLTDVILIVMLLPWLVGLSLRREQLYFPKIGYLYVLFLCWSLLVSLLNAVSLYLTFFEFCRQILYFLSFVYFINNVKTPAQLRSVILAVFLGLIVGAGSIIAFFELGIGTDTVAFADLHDQPTAASTQIGQATTQGWAPQALTLNNSNNGLGAIGGRQGSDVRRSQGMFRHPAIAASLCAITLPLVLAYLITARNYGQRVLFFGIYAWGFIGLLLTFSRAGLIGCTVGTLVLFALAGWSRLVSRQAVALVTFTWVSAAILSIPLLLMDFTARSETFFMRFNMMEAAVMGYAQHPFLGVGLNNSTAAMKETRQELQDLGIPMPPTESADSYYVAVLTEVGPLGFILFFAFFAQIVMIAIRAIEEVPEEMKPLLVGMVGGLASLATQSLADEPVAGHAVGGTLWLFAALIIVIRRQSAAATRPAVAGGEAGAGPVPIGNAISLSR